MSSEPLAMQPPDSWENSDIDERLKSLSIHVTSSGKPLSGGLETNSSIDAFDDNVSGPDTRPANGDALSSRQVSSSQTQGAGLTQKALEQVDSFLLEALQNPRDRITILRFEKDVERFMRNPSAQTLEFESMGSSYIRLAAHRVAQHYFLQSQAVDVSIPERSRIIARKTAESRFPAIRLADIPVNVEESASPVVNPPSQVVMLKQRPGGSRQGERVASSASSSQLNTQKTVEERNEEYKRARARIFNNGVEEDDSTGENASQSTEELSQSNPKSESQKTGSESSSYKKHSDKTPSSVSSQTEFPADLGNPNSNEKLREGDEGTPAGKSSSAHTERGNAGRRPCVAIIRDRELDKMDPDYNRNYDRYAQRFDPGFGMQIPNPYGVHGLYAPVMNYNTEFPSLVSSRPQQHSGILGNVRLEPSPQGVHPYSVQQGLWPRIIRPMATQYSTDQVVPYNYNSNQMSGQMLHHLSGQMGNSTSHPMLNLIGNQAGNQAANVAGSQAVHQRGNQSGNQMGNQFANPSAMRSSAINPSVYYQHYGMNSGVHFNSAHLQSSASAYSPYPTSERFKTSTIPNDIQSNPPASASRRN